MMQNDIQLLYEKSRNEPNKPRFMVKNSEEKWQPITWTEFFNSAMQLANYLVALEVGWNQKVSLFAKNRVEWAYFNAAIHAVRGVFVPIYLSSTPEQAKYIINHSDSKVLVTEVERLPGLFRVWQELASLQKVIIMDLTSEQELLEEIDKSKSKITLADLSSKIISLTEIYQQSKLQNSHKLPPFLEEVQLADVSAILYTSGTTGEPKGVVLTHANLQSNAEDWIQVLGNLLPDSKIDLHWLPMSHIFGWGELGLGNTLEFTSYLTTHGEVMKHLPEVRPTIFMSVPAYWEKLYLDAKSSSPQKAKQLQKLQELTGGRLQFCLSGGAGLKREAKEFFYEAGLLIIEGYGLTECSPTLTMNRKDDFDFDTVGKPFPRVQLQLAEDGEILAKGPNVFKEYYKNQLVNQESFDQEGWFKTGDLGTWTNRGFLKIKGRKKEIIVTSGGKNIAPNFIESLFKDDTYIEHIVLYGSEHKYLTALVTLKENNIMNYAKAMHLPHQHYSELVNLPQIRALVQKSIEEVNKSLASFETIKSFFIHDGHLTVEGGFLTPSLKLRRNRVWEIFKDRLEILY